MLRKNTEITTAMANSYLGLVPPVNEKRSVQPLRLRLC